VVNQSCLSIRALQQRFRRAIGCSINQEIHRVRIQQLADHLINTNLTINQIACDLAFRDISHISRVFRKEMGMAPMEYRRRFGHHG
jgi:transcriptional regulator GlxA family with amidase domain